MACNLPSLTNGNEDSILGRELELLVGTEKAKEYLAYFATPELIEIFGDYHAEHLNDNVSELFKGRVSVETGEPQLFLDRTLDKHFFLDRYNERVYYPYERVGLNGIFTTSETKELTESLALVFAKANNLNLDLDTLKFEASKVPIQDLIKEQLSALSKRLNKSDEIEDISKAIKVENSLKHIDEWINLVKQYFQSNKITLVESEEEESERQQSEETEMKGSGARVESFLKSHRTNMLSNVKMFLSLIEDTRKNSFGLYKFVPFDNIYTTLFKELSDLQSIKLPTKIENSTQAYENLYDVYVNRIKDLVGVKPFLKNLVSKLQDPAIATDAFKNQFVSSFYLFKKNFLGSEFSIDENGNITYEIKNLSEVGSRQSNILTAWYDNFMKLYSRDTLTENVTKLKEYTQLLNTKDKSFQPKNLDQILRDVQRHLAGIGIYTDPSLAGLKYYLNNNSSIETDFEEKMDKISTLLNDRLYKRILVPYLDEAKRSSLFDFNIFKTQSGELGKLAKAEAFFMEETSDASIFTMGKTKWTYSNPSFLDLKIGEWKRDPNALLEHYKSQKFNKGSRVMQYLLGMSKSNGYKFNKKLSLQRLSQLEIGVFNSLQEEYDATNAVDNDDISYTDSLVDYIHKILGVYGSSSNKSWWKTALAADKSTEYQIHYGVDLMQTNARYENGNYTIDDEPLEVLLNYFLDEYARMNEVSSNIVNSLVDSSIELLPNYHLDNRNGLRSQLFPEISPVFENGMLQSVPDSPLSFNLFNEAGHPEFETLSNAQKAELKEKYIKPKILQKIIDFNEILLRENIVAYNTDGVLVNNSVDNSIFDFYKEGTDANVAKAAFKVAGDIIVNGIISQVEYAKMFTGDLAYYKNMIDYRKRVPATYTDGLYLNVYNEEDLTFNISVIESLEIDDPSYEYLKEYTSADVANQYKRKDPKSKRGPVDSTDAQAWITPKRWRFLMEKMGKWTSEHDAVWEEMNKKIPQFTEAQRKIVAQPLKGVYFDVTSGRPVFLKYSQAVLVPNLVRNLPTLSKILTKMQNQNIDELITSGGIKVGMPIPNRIHDDNGNLLEDFKLNVLPLNNRFWKLQQDLPTKGIKLTDVGSQIQKNIFQALVFNLEDKFTLENGKDYTGDAMIDYLNQLSTSILYKNKANVYKELGINPTTGKIDNEEALYERIIKQLEARRDVPKNLINGLKMGLSPYGIPGATEIFQNVFSSIINNDLNKIKTNGGGFIQMADFGLTKGEASSKGVKFTPWFLEGKDERATMPQFTIDKQTGRKKLTPSGIFVPGNLISKYIPNYQKYSSAELFGTYNEKTGRYLGGMIDMEILENIIGYRIPNQGLVSNDAFRVVGILPEGMGDTVVAYAGITKKTGSDFDIDKMYLMTPSVIFDEVENKLRYEKPKLRGKLETSEEVLVHMLQGKFIETEELPLDEQSMGVLRNKLIEAYKNILLQGDPSIMDKVFRPLDMDFMQTDIDNLNTKQEEGSFDNFDAIDDIETKLKFKTSKAGLGVAVNNTMDFVRSAMGDMKLKANLGWGNIENGLNVLDREKSEELSDADLNAYIKDYNGRVEEKKQIKDIKEFKRLNASIGIGDSFMALTNAFVDVANNPFIVEGNWVNQTNNLGMMLLRAGVHPFKVNALLNQPIVKNYVNFINNVESKTVESARYPIMSFKIRKIAESLPRDEESENITISGITLSPREVFYALIEPLQNIEYKYKVANTEETADEFKEYTKFQEKINAFKKDIFYKISDIFNVRNDINEPLIKAQLQKVTEQLTTVLEDSLFVEPIKFKSIDLATLRRQNRPGAMDLAVQEAVLGQYIKWTQLARHLSKSVTASRTDGEGKGKNIGSLITSINRIREVMADKTIIGFETKYSRNGKRTALGTSLDLTLVNMEDLMINNPKYFTPYRKSVIQTFNNISNSTKNSLLVDDNLANSLLRNYTTYLLSGFPPFQLSDTEKESVIKDTPAMVKELQDIYKDNAFLNELFLKEAGNIIENGKPVAKIFQLGVSNAKKSVTIKDGITDGFRDLLETEPEKAEKLIQYAFLSSGGVKTINDFFEYIPYEWFNRNRFNQYLHDFINRDSHEEAKDRNSAMDVSFAFQYMRHNLENSLVVPRNDFYISTDERTGTKKVSVNRLEGMKGFSYRNLFQTTRSDSNHPPFIKVVEPIFDGTGIKTGAITLYFYKLAVQNGKAIYARTTPLGLNRKSGGRALEYDITKDGILDPMVLSAFQENNNPKEIPYPRKELLDYIKNNPDKLDYSTGAFGGINVNDSHSLEEVKKLTPTPETTTKKVVETIKEAVSKPTKKIVEKKVPENLDISEKEGINGLFDSNPELASIGTQQQYSQYLDSIFPDSKVKDIVYHGTKVEFDKFDKSKLGSNLGWISSDTKKGFYFGTFKEAKGYGHVSSEGKNKQRIISVILNIENPKIVTSEEYINIANKYADDKNVARRPEPRNFESKLVNPLIDLALKNNNDGLILEDVFDYSRGNQQLVFEPEQIHILGSKQDIEGFKKYTSENLDMSEKSNTFVEDDKINMDFYGVTFTQPYKEDASLESLGAYNPKEGIRVRPNIEIQEFMDYITGKTDSPTSRQKQIVFDNLVENFGYSMEEIEKIFNTAADVKAFIIYHEISHLEHKDNVDIVPTYEKLWASYFEEKGMTEEKATERFQAERIFLPEVIIYETRATMDAFNMIKLVQDKYQKHLVELQELETGEFGHNIGEVSTDTQQPRWGMTPQSFKEYIQDLGDSNQLGFDFGNNPCK